MAWEKYDAGMIEPKHMSSINQLAYLLSKHLGRSLLEFFYNLLDLYDINTT